MDAIPKECQEDECPGCALHAGMEQANPPPAAPRGSAQEQDVGWQLPRESTTGGGFKVM